MVLIFNQSNQSGYLIGDNNNQESVCNQTQSLTQHNSFQLNLISRKYGFHVRKTSNISIGNRG